MKDRLVCMSLSVLLSVFLTIIVSTVYAQSADPKTVLFQSPLRQSKYLSTQTILYSDGTELERIMIHSPPVPPLGHEIERSTLALPEPNQAMGTNTLTVPAFNWVFGCSAVSAAMIAGYYDRNGWENMYAGPTNGGVMPLIEDPAWGNWTDGSVTYPNNPLIASHSGLDGRTTNGSIDDYWVAYYSWYSDPYITGHWTQHAWGDAIGDYMKTSQSKYENVDGGTTFYNWTSLASPLTCDNMVSYGIHTKDGTYGRKLFYQARGYKVTKCYNQRTDNKIAGGFSFARYKAEIDASRPVLLNLKGHSIVGIGYDDFSRTIYIHDTWDNDVHSMPWDGSYYGMTLHSVSIVNVSLDLTSPNGGEIVPAGSDITIKWTALPDMTKFKLQYSVDKGSTWLPITPDLDFATGTSMTWTTPTTFTKNKTKCLIKVIGFNDSGKKLGSDTSNEPFTIETLTITNPAAGDTCTSGQPCNITWTRSPNIDAQTGKLFSSTDGGLTWKVITDIIIGSDISYEWTPPPIGATKKNCKVKLAYKNSQGVTVAKATSGKFTINKAP